MFEINYSMFIGFGLVLVTIAVIALLVKYMISKHISDSEQRIRILGIYFSVVPGIFIVAFVMFVLAFVWTGWHPVSSPHPQGELDHDEAGQLEYTPGENRPQERKKRLEQGDELQREGQRQLQEFRDKLFLKNKE